MKNLTIGKIRGLQQIANPDGIFTVCAMDHRGSLRRMIKSELVEICRQLDASSQVPLVILSGGVDFELFCQQVEIACQVGASGFLGVVLSGKRQCVLMMHEKGSGTCPLSGSRG